MVATTDEATTADTSMAIMATTTTAETGMPTDKALTAVIIMAIPEAVPTIAETPASATTVMTTEGLTTGGDLVVEGFAAEVSFAAADFVPTQAMVDGVEDTANHSTAADTGVDGRTAEGIVADHTD